ncbi:unnamed protein product [Linum trigynum]|uniref:Uncharacterized protein n=1 Tax=Linum trigynum TaxID=586398 RepID=A0AAV2CY62_9ROSI
MLGEAKSSSPNIQRHRRHCRLIRRYRLCLRLPVLLSSVVDMDLDIGRNRVTVSKSTDPLAAVVIIFSDRSFGDIDVPSQPLLTPSYAAPSHQPSSSLTS